jgi:peptidoglycan/LPS O-acetylase OafA/YrhL
MLSVMKLKYIDSLRGIAILGVLIVHSAFFVEIGNDYNLFDFALAGQRGVQLFYLTSAFTLFLSLNIRTSQEKYPNYNFFVRRFFRIAPLFYIAIIANLIYQRIFTPPELSSVITFLDILLGFLFLHGVTPETIGLIAMGGWSIAVETSFYVLAPVLYSKINTLKKSILLLLFSSVFLFSLSYELSKHFPENREYFTFLWFPIEFPIFCMGIVCYHTWKKLVLPLDVQKNRENREYKSWSMLSIVFSLAVFLSSLPINNSKLYWSSFAFVPLLLGLSIHEWYFFVNPITRFLGKISYSIYLIHPFIFILVKHYFSISEVQLKLKLIGTIPGFGLFFIISTLVTIILSCITYAWIELPGIQVGKSLILYNETRAQA